MFVRKNGLYLLDVVDHYNNSYTIIIIAIAEACVLLALGKELLSFMQSRSAPWALRLVGRGRLLYGMWVALVVFLVYTLWQNISSGFWVYDTYDRSFLRLGVAVVV
ncbi:MAG: hypothetical protein H6765_08240 [Candidatus Peribacteria bacterium]|nr:MAG: hypothetical protein H6765_08240 [Candidatus Peribacteria bacterium]